MGKVNLWGVYGEIKEYVVDHKKTVLAGIIVLIILILFAMFGLWYES